MGEPERGRIAIKFGAPSSSSAPSSARPSPRPRKPPPPSPPRLGKRPRSSVHALAAASDSDSGDDAVAHRHTGRHEAITGFGADGAETERDAGAGKAVKKEYVIARQPNRDWRAEARAQQCPKGPRPGEAERGQQGAVAAVVVEREPPDEEKGITWGLTVKERRTDGEDGAPDAAAARQPQDAPAQREPPPAERTLDDEAMDALLGRSAVAPKTIIRPPPLSEDQVYRRDAEAAGAESTLADYEDMPVEEFGAALLRGMGWSGEERAPRLKEVRRRPNRLGLGAKELKEDEDLGGWNQAGQKKKRPRLDEYRREEEKRRDGRRHEDSYKRERERERERERDPYRERDRHRDYRDRDHHRHRDYDRDRRR